MPKHSSLSTNRAKARRPGIGKRRIARRVGCFEVLEPRLPLSASSIDGKPYVDIGPSDSVAWDQPRVTVQLINELDQICRPNTFNVWLLDTGKNTILSFQTAISDMNASPPFMRWKVYSRNSVWVVNSCLISRVPTNLILLARVGFAIPSRGQGLFRIRTAILVRSDLGVSWACPPMTERVTTLDLSVWTTLVDLQLFMEVDFQRRYRLQRAPLFGAGRQPYRISS